MWINVIGLGCVDLNFIKFVFSLGEKKGDFKLYKSFFDPLIALLISTLVLALSAQYLSLDLDISALLTAILQSLASLLAIITAFTLIAVQLSSQSYSPRMLKFSISIKNNKIFWSIVVLYLISMIYCLLILTKFGKGPLDYFELFLTLVGILLAFWCYMSIPYYIIETIDKLKPENVIKELIQEVNIDLIKKISKYSNNNVITDDFTDNNHIPPEDDPLIAIVDIIIGAIKEGHINTAETGLRLLGNAFKKFIDEDYVNENNSKEIYIYLLDHLERVKLTSIKNEDPKTLSLLIEIIDRIGTLYSNFDPNCILFSLNFFGDVLNEIVGFEFGKEILYLLKFYESKINESLNKITKKTGIPWHIFVFTGINYLNTIWIISVHKNENNIKINCEIITNSLFTNIIKKEFLNIISNQIFFLMNFGIDSLDENIDVIDKILSNLDSLFNDLFKKYHQNNVSNSKSELSYKLIINIIESLKNIGQESIQKNKQDFKIGSYLEWEEIFALKESIISKIFIILGQITISFIDQPYNENRDWKMIHEIVFRSVTYIGLFSIDLVEKRSNSVDAGIESLTSILNSSSRIRQGEQLFIVSEIINLMETLGSLLILKNQANIISKCALLLNECSLWAEKNDARTIRLETTKILGKLGMKLVGKPLFSDDLKTIMRCLKEIIIRNSSRNNSEIDFKYSLMEIQKIAEKMHEKDVDESEMRYLFDLMDSIMDHINKSNFEYLSNKIYNWLNRIKEDHKRDF